jgi:hypothetical protein
MMFHFVSRIFTMERRYALIWRDKSFVKGVAVLDVPSGIHAQNVVVQEFVKQSCKWVLEWSQ